MSGLRFAFLTTFYPPYNFGGDGIGIQRLARGLVDAGHQVTVIHDADAYNALRQGRSRPRQPPSRTGSRSMALRSGAATLSPLLTQQLGRPVVNGARIRAAAARSATVRRDQFPQRLASSGVRACFKYGAGSSCTWRTSTGWSVPRTCCGATTGALHRPASACAASCSFERPPQLWRWTGFLERELRHVDAFIAMSEFSREKHREFGFPREMEVLPYFLPETRTAAGGGRSGPARTRDPISSSSGRLEKIKGLR